MPERDTIAGRLRSLREASGLTQYALAQRAGVARAVVHRIEAGQRLPSWPVLRKLALALGADLGDFAGCD